MKNQNSKVKTCLPAKAVVELLPVISKEFSTEESFNFVIKKISPFGRNDNAINSETRQAHRVQNLVWLLLVFSFTIFSCGKNYSPEQKEYIEKIEKVRTEKNDYMKNDPSSPFNQDPAAEFHPLKYYDVNPDFVFKSKIYPFSEKDTVKVMGTKGEERQAVKYGYVKFDFKGSEYKINVYKGWTKSGEEYYSIWFTDETTGNETYGVGRYLDFELNPYADYIYTIDFNLAYNPYCAYSAKYSCAVPRKEDYIALAIEAGEKKFHN